MFGGSAAKERWEHRHWTFPSKGVQKKKQYLFRLRQVWYASLKMTYICRYLSVTNAAWKTQTQIRKICKQSCTPFQKLMCVQTQRSSEEAFHFFGRNLLILGRSLLICGGSLLICSASWAANAFWNTFQMSALFLLCTVLSIKDQQNWLSYNTETNCFDSFVSCCWGVQT